MQLKPATENPLKVVEWGCSFDGSAAATPGKVELIETDVAATVTTAFVVGDVGRYDSFGDTPVQTSGKSGIPLTLGTTASGFASASGTEGTTTASRMADVQLIAPTNQYLKQWPLGREFMVQPGKFLRVRVTFAATVNMICYVIFEV